MRAQLFGCWALFVLASFGVCQPPPPGGPPGRSFGPPYGEVRSNDRRAMDLATRDNALALLQELMSEEKRLSKLLTIKDESRELNQLVRTISENADRVEDRLKPFERREHRPSRNPADLPPGEVAARESMARVKHQLLAQSKGSEFELHLLLAEAESLNYAIHLARVAGENEPQSAAAEEYNNMSMRFKELYHRVLGMLRSRR